MRALHRRLNQRLQEVQQCLYYAEGTKHCLVENVDLISRDLFRASSIRMLTLHPHLDFAKKDLSRIVTVDNILDPNSDFTPNSTDHISNSPRYNAAQVRDLNGYRMIPYHIVSCYFPQGGQYAFFTSSAQLMFFFCAISDSSETSASPSCAKKNEKLVLNRSWWDMEVEYLSIWL